MELFGTAVTRFTSRLASREGATVNPEVYGVQLAARLLPVMLPYELGTDAAFGLAAFNGRPLGTDAYDVVLTLGANRPITDGVSPDVSRISGEFPYYGRPFYKEEQAELQPISTEFYE